MKATGPFRLHVGRFVRWHALLTGFDVALALGVGWDAWVWHGQSLAGLMNSLALAVFLVVLGAQVPYWKIRAFTLIHDVAGWKLVQGHRQEDLAEVRALRLPGQLVVMGTSGRGRVILPVPSDISASAWQELRARLAL